jgi:hypothetical protein
MYTKRSLATLQKALDKLSEGFTSLPAFEQAMPAEMPDFNQYTIVMKISRTQYHSVGGCS